MFVREITVEEAAQLYDIRASLFGLAGRLAAARVGAAEAQALRATADSLDKADSMDDYYPLNVGLHRHLVALSGSPRLVELYDGVSKELHLFRRHGLELAPPGAPPTSSTVASSTSSRPATARTPPA